ncbi:hypothetical protein ES319_A07G123600v1 [Gossypium barbadense]|uniref:Uncharacterized protein n=2 Tax=Gossypium TaxID=3633 RepID=A0A5J5V2W7_GOSBA|nr:hypothetical protein ES319_A07G123600v1 [Gossypium barbadense]TYH09873.1 hypothetical protein ES288_A07G132400v1 [Gossypium darwinii]
MILVITSKQAVPNLAVKEARPDLKGLEEIHKIQRLSTLLGLSPSHPHSRSIWGSHRLSIA